MSGVADPEAETLIADLVSAAPSLGPLVDEHMQTHGELLPHVLFGDLTRFIVAAATKGDASTVKPVLDLLERGLTAGDPVVVNLIQVSFVENVGVWNHGMDSFINSWPGHLRAEAERQGWRPAGSA
jgi:hypothetical protein